jgi:Type II restriction endonuclease EcoO109I
MNAKTRALIQNYVHKNIDTFHARRLARIKSLKLGNVLENKNPYLFRAKNLNRAAHFMTALLDARLSSSEEGSFGKFLEGLAIFVAQRTGGGMKSGIEGIDIEVTRDQVRYLIAVKSGKKWGNAQARKKQNQDFRRAVKVIKQEDRTTILQPTLGICYGKFKTENTGDYLHIGGQSFWHLLSGDRELYVDLIEPLGHEAETHATEFDVEKDATYNRLTAEFIDRYCDAEYNIDWSKLVRFVSENLPQKVRRTRRVASKAKEI